jgi:Rad3-related DNA helicase
MKHQKDFGLEDLLANFPTNLYPKILENQKETFTLISENNGSLTAELPTGSGKTAIGYTFLKTLEKTGKKQLFYITVNKTLVDQVKKMHQDVKVVYGRNEYQCLYYKDSYVDAEESPCSMLNCRHRVNQETGMTQETGVDACPYLRTKYEARQGGIVVCTMSFYLFAIFFDKSWKEKPEGLVIDEVHQIAKVVRNSLSYEITDYHLERVVDFLTDVSPMEAAVLNKFRIKMIRIVKRRPSADSIEEIRDTTKSVRQGVLLETHEIRELLNELEKIDHTNLIENVKRSVRELCTNAELREILKRLELLVHGLSGYISSLTYSLSNREREPLNYLYGFYRKDNSEEKRVNYRLFIKSYYVRPIITKILAERTLSYSATIGDSEILDIESGIKAPFYTLTSDFSADNTRIFLPTDTPNLAVKARSSREPTRVLRKIAKACKRFVEKGHRCLVVVVSNKERDKFLMLCGEEGVDSISYGNGVKPREAAIKFKDGVGDVLVGTTANYGEGVDLPERLAPIIFFLRPGYPNPRNPLTIFEEKRFKGARWQLWNWRVMMEALQVRGRNVRSVDCIGVTFFISQQFRRFLKVSLPEQLMNSYKGDMDWEKCLEETEAILK